MVMQQPAVGMNNQKGRSHVVDDCCNTHNSMAVGIGDRLYDGLFYSYPAGHCHRHCFGQSHSGAEAPLERDILTTQKAFKRIICMMFLLILSNAVNTGVRSTKEPYMADIQFDYLILLSP